MLPSLDPKLHLPERLPFIKKLRNFLEDHGFDGVPTLVLQCEVGGAQVNDLAIPKLAHALLNGAGQSVQGDWWSGFMGGNTIKVFDGLASRDESIEPRWATELQQDGHILAAVRLNVHQDLKGVHPAILNAFSQFGLLVQRLHAAAAIKGKLAFTATLVNGKGLGMLTLPRFGQPLVRPLGRDVLEWPVSYANKTDDVPDICEGMSKRMSRVFP